jgi:hypothetical protein
LKKVKLRHKPFLTRNSRPISHLLALHFPRPLFVLKISKDTLPQQVHPDTHKGGYRETCSIGLKEFAGHEDICDGVSN